MGLLNPSAFSVWTLHSLTPTPDPTLLRQTDQMDPSFVSFTPSFLSQSLYRAGGSRSVRIGDPTGKGDPGSD